MISLSQSQGNSSLVWEGIYWIDADGLFCSSAWPLCESEQPWSVGKWERREQEAFQLPVSESSGSSYSAEWRKVEWLQCSCCEKSRGKPVRVSSAVSTYTLPSLLWLVPPTFLFDLPAAREARMQNKASVVIGLSGRNLKDLDLFSKSDPYVVISR